jgi:FlaG/FlaF family flagellin (archaellin)
VGALRLRKKLRLNNRGISTVVGEMLMLVIAVILVSTFVVALQSDVSSYVKTKDLSTIHVWTTTNDGFVNLTAIHSGGDPLAISGQLYIEYQNGTSKGLVADLTYNNETSPVDGAFSLSEVKFGEQFLLSIDVISPQIDNGTIHYIISSKTQILAEVDQKIEV